MITNFQLTLVESRGPIFGASTPTVLRGARFPSSTDMVCDAMAMAVAFDPYAEAWRELRRDMTDADITTVMVSRDRRNALRNARMPPFLSSEPWADST